MQIGDVPCRFKYASVSRELPMKKKANQEKLTAWEILNMSEKDLNKIQPLKRITKPCAHGGVSFPAPSHAFDCRYRKHSKFVAQTQDDRRPKKREARESCTRNCCLKTREEMASESHVCCRHGG